MKKIIIPISALFIAGLAHAQLSPTENYVYSKTYLSDPALSIPKTSETVQYFDGLGRPKQVVNVKASPLGKDVVTNIEYDGFGRQVKDFLPIPQSGTLNGAIVPTPLANAPSVYGSEKIYAEKVLENSPLDRIQQQIQVGNDWSNKPVKFGYDTNAEYEVYKFTTNTTWTNNATLSTLVFDFFPPNQLYKTTVTDEDGNITKEYKNGKGQVIMVRKFDGTYYTDTYYVYNEYDQLAFVIPPKAIHLSITDTLLNDLCYQYRYDGRGRLVEKKLPGKGWEYMVYDKQDRLVATQDTILKEKGQWLYTKYDQFGRVAITGIGTGDTRSAEQAIVDGLGSNNVNRLNSALFERQGMGVYYGNQDSTYPNSTKWVTLLSLNYYDTYPSYSFNPTFPTSLIGGEVPLSDDPSTDGRSTKGLPVMSLVKNIEDDNWTKNYTYYDKKGRVIGTHSINHLGGYTRSETQLDFAGAPQKTLTFQVRKGGESGVTVNERFIYDNQNRLLQHYHQVDSQPEELLAQNEYNELSQLKNKKVGNNLQSIDYDYNIRGWMTHINKDQMAVPNLGGKLFSYKIKYTQKEGIENPDPAQFGGKNVKAKYNGNIAEVDWRAVETLGINPSSTPKRYGYAYDNLNRLSAGYYQNPNNPYSKENTESLAYDLNGNITSLYRTSVMENGNTTATVIDNLQYTYQGNRLTKVDDYANNPTGYEGGGNSIGYDANGNMLSMPDKGIFPIRYNYLNLPEQIDLEQGGSPFTANYMYGADGTKVKKTTVSTVSGYNTSTVITENTDYLDGFQYKHRQTETFGGNPGGGDMEMLAAQMETGRAMEMQAYSPESTATTQATATVKTEDLQFFLTAEGFYDYTKDQYIYNYKDQLGNVRLSFGRTSTGALEIVDSNDYYPFGMNHLKSGNSYFGAGSYKNYKYNGKELQETGMYDYGARLYMPDIGRWGVVDPLAETSRRWSAYAYAYNNPIRFIDPDGMQNEDKIKIFNNGNIERTKDNNAYDTIVNEDESKSIQIARTNVTEDNPTGDSQIGDAKTIPYNMPGHDEVAGGTEFTYMQIQDYDVATQIFEFASNNTSVEFGQDTFSFSDGFSTNIVSTNHSVNETISAAGLLENNNLGGSEFHITKDAIRQERVHSHPLGAEWGPSGFNAYRDRKTGRIVTEKGLNAGDRKNYNSNIQNVYQYTPGVGYFKYNNKTATHIGNKKK
jgi:RHS repeat-associated protein